MGCNESVSNDSIVGITDEQIEQIKSSTISPVSYQIFLNNFYFVSRYDKFYTDLPLDKQLLVLENVGTLTKDECITVIGNFCKNANSEEELVPVLHQVSKKLVCKTKIEGNDEEVYIPVSLNEKLWKSIMCKKYPTKYGKFKMDKSTIDWTSEEITSDRDVFLGDFQNQIPQVNHTKNIAILISSNPIEHLWKKDMNTEEISPDINLNASKPLNWEPSIHEAAYKGKKSSVEYNLALMPQILNLPDSKDNTPVHYAAMGNQKSVLIYLRDIGANFKLQNSDGFFPIHLISKKSIVKSLSELGVNINERNADGETLLDIKTRDFDKAMIKTMIGLGVNILEPNPDGSFWIQKALHNGYYVDSMNEDKFVAFVRKLLISNKQAIYNYNPIYEKIIQRKDKTHKKEDMDDLNESVMNQDIPRISVLLAIGTKPDEKLPTGETNLYLCSKRGLTDSARILAQNFADPNFTNSQHENTFWVAAINEHFDTALVLRDNGADMNMLDVNNETLMHNVYRRKITKIFEFTLEAGASPNVKNGQCQTVTFIAFLTRDDEVAEKLQDKYKGDINAQDHLQFSLAHHAFTQGDLKRIEYLSSRKIDMNLRNSKGHSVLMMAFFTEINFNTWTFLLDKGSDISTFDFNNNTLLHHLFMMKNAREDVFRFLIDHKINYDIENRNGQFPISIAIEMCHDKFGFELLDKNCKIIDNYSVHEPIVEALKRGNQKWIESLFNHGADACNKHVGVLSRYINSGFFKYQIFKNIPRMNIFLEAPLQMAIYKNFKNCAIDIWDLADDEPTKIALAGNTDCYGRIPLSAALKVKDEKFVSILLDKKYDCQTSDKEGKTPFIYACIADNLTWMSKLFDIISLSNANHVDNSNCSALTYAACNDRKDFCDMLFINDIEVFDIKVDSNGIINKYRRLINRYIAAKNFAKRNYESASDKYQSLRRQESDCLDDIRELNRKIDNLNSDINYHNNNDGGFISETIISFRKSSIESDRRTLECRLERIQSELRVASENVDYYARRYNQICEMTRKDILYNINQIEYLSERNR